MFCLTCGTEIPALARACLACGTPVTGRGDGGESGAIALAVPASAAVSAVVASHTMPAAHGVSATAAASASATDAPSISVGDLPGVSFPRDLAGRLVLGFVILLALTQLLPWAVLKTTSATNVTSELHVQPATFGVPSVLLVLALVLSVVPAFAPTLRTHALWGIAPVVLGALALGFALMTWLSLGSFATLIADHTVFTIAVFGGRGTAPTAVTHPPTITPDFGLYVFAVAALALVVAGSRMLADANRSLVASLSTPAARQISIPPVVARDDSENISTETDMPVAAEAANGTNGHTANDGASNIPLPGTARWDQPPPSPASFRPYPTSWTPNRR